MRKGEKFIVAALVLAKLFSSCTVSVPCDNGNIKLGFVAFSDTATDSIIIRQFKKSSSFQILVDTVLITKSIGSYKKNSDSLQIEYSFNKNHGYTTSNDGLTSEYDYEVYLPTIDKTFKITDIDEEYKKQKKGFFSDNSRCDNYIKAYSVNGQKFNGEFTDLTIYFHH